MWIVKISAAVVGYIVGANIVYAAVSYIDDKAQQLADKASY